MAQNSGYRFVRSITAYFVGNSGQWVKSTMNFGLYTDGYNVFVGCTNRYGTSFHNIVPSSNRSLEICILLQRLVLF